MPIEMQPNRNGAWGFYPAVVCDTCGERIETLDGLVYWDWRQQTDQPIFLHRLTCQPATVHERGLYYWLSLTDFLTLLVRNLDRPNFGDLGPLLWEPVTP